MSSVSSVPQPAVTKQAFVYTGGGSGTAVVNLGVSFDRARTVVMISSATGETRNWWWASSSQIWYYRANNENVAISLMELSA